MLTLPVYVAAVVGPDGHGPAPLTRRRIDGFVDGSAASAVLGAAAIVGALPLQLAVMWLAQRSPALPSIDEGFQRLAAHGGGSPDANRCNTRLCLLPR